MGEHLKLSMAASAVFLGLAGALGSAGLAVAQPSPVPYICNYDVLCDAAGNVIQGPPLGSGGVRLGNGQICEWNGCTRP